MSPPSVVHELVGEPLGYISISRVRISVGFASLGIVDVPLGLLVLRGERVPPPSVVHEIVGKLLGFIGISRVRTSVDFSSFGIIDITRIKVPLPCETTIGSGCRQNLIIGREGGTNQRAAPSSGQVQNCN